MTIFTVSVSDSVTDWDTAAETDVKWNAHRFGCVAVTDSVSKTVTESDTD